MEGGCRTYKRLPVRAPEVAAAQNGGIFEEVEEEQERMIRSKITRGVPHLVVYFFDLGFVGPLPAAVVPRLFWSMSGVPWSPRGPGPSPRTT